MKICVFGAASSTIDDSYKKEAFEICRALAGEGHSLVFGGGKEGLMGEAARGFHASDGHVTGVLPEFFRQTLHETLYTECDEVIYTPDISERIKHMIMMGDAFLVLPGGIGTYEEFFSVFVLKNLDRHKKPIILFNSGGYFDPVLRLLEHTAERGFLARKSIDGLMAFDFSQKEELLEFLRS